MLDQKFEFMVRYDLIEQTGALSSAVVLLTAEGMCVYGRSFLILLQLQDFWYHLKKRQDGATGNCQKISLITL